MIQQLKWFILTCLSLTLFSYESLHRAKEVGAQQIPTNKGLHLRIFFLSTSKQSKIPLNYIS